MSAGINVGFGAGGLDIGARVNFDFGVGSASIGTGIMGHDVYNQHFIAISIAGHTIQDLMDGNPIRFNPQGGQTSITEGTNSPGLNIATKQGCIIEFDLKEISPDHEFIADINRTQYEGGGAVPVTLFTGTGRTFSCGAYVSQPSGLTTGGPKMGSHTYTLVTTQTDLY